MKRLAVRRSLVTLLGGLVLLLGLVLLPAPGPGLLVILAGLYILGTEYEWAKRRHTDLTEQIERLKNILQQRLRRKPR